jgi:hypothetical protein
MKKDASKMEAKKRSIDKQNREIWRNFGKDLSEGCEALLVISTTYVYLIFELFDMIIRCRSR